jgi:hypothetical protein
MKLAQVSCPQVKKEVIGMSNPQSPAYREGIWEIRETSITARLPEGAWVLRVRDIEFIRLQSGMENGVAFCDAFIKPRESSRPYPVGRYASEKEGICKVLGQFADYNKVPLLSGSGPQAPDAQAPEIKTPSVSGKSRRQVIPFPKAPDYPLQTEKPPLQKQGASEEAPQADIDMEQGAGTGQDAGLNMGINPNQSADAQQGNIQGQGFDSQQDYDPGQGFDPQQNYDPAQGFGPGQTWWQWAFNPANPKFKKTITIISLVAAAIILLGATGVFRGLRMQSISGPGIVGIYFILRAMKNRKPKNRFGPGNPPPGSPWGPYPQQPGTWKTEYTGPSSGNTSENASEKASESASENTSGNTSGDTTDSTSENPSGNTSGNAPGNTPGNTPGEP